MDLKALKPPFYLWRSTNTFWKERHQHQQALIGGRSGAYRANPNGSSLQLLNPLCVSFADSALETVKKKLSLHDCANNVVLFQPCREILARVLSNSVAAL